MTSSHMSIRLDYCLTMRSPRISFWLNYCLPVSSPRMSIICDYCLSVTPPRLSIRLDYCLPVTSLRTSIKLDDCLPVTSPRTQNLKLLFVVIGEDYCENFVIVWDCWRYRYIVIVWWWQVKTFTSIDSIFFTTGTARQRTAIHVRLSWTCNNRN